jgi:hypothetical protein
MDGESINVREVDVELFQEFAGDAAFAVTVMPSGEEELVVPVGTEYEPDDLPDEEISVLYAVRASSCYEKCRRGKKYRCCRGICVKIGSCD